MLSSFINESVSAAQRADGIVAVRTTETGISTAFSGVDPFSGVDRRRAVANIAMLTSPGRGVSAAAQIATSSARTTELPKTAHSRIRYAHPASVIRSKHRIKLR